LRVVINGKSEIISISINPELDKEKQEQSLKDCINDAFNEAKMLMARRASEITGFGL
jgi:DNA-binding protein YbaB